MLHQLSFSIFLTFPIKIFRVLKLLSSVCFSHNPIRWYPCFHQSGQLGQLQELSLTIPQFFHFFLVFVAIENLLVFTYSLWLVLTLMSFLIPFLTLNYWVLIHFIGAVARHVRLCALIVNVSFRKYSY